MQCQANTQVVHSFLDFVDQPYRGIIVPQLVSPAPVAYEPTATIKFWYGGRLGIPLHLALRREFSTLAQSMDTPATTSAALRVTFKVHVRTPEITSLLMHRLRHNVSHQWPGYGTWQDKLQVVDHSAEHRPYTIGQLAWASAKLVQRFLAVCTRALLPRHH